MAVEGVAGFESLQRREVDDEAVAHIALDHAVVGVVDVLYQDHLDVGQHVLLDAEIQHLLRFLNPADQGAGQVAAVEDGADSDRRRLVESFAIRCSHNRRVPIDSYPLTAWTILAIFWPECATTSYLLPRRFVTSRP